MRPLSRWEDPIGKKITFAVSGRALTCEIVGVVGDVRPNGLDSAPRLEIYLPYAQSPASLVTWVVRTTGDPLKELSAIKGKIREGNPTQTFLSIATMDHLVDRTITQRRFNLMLLGSFAKVIVENHDVHPIEREKFKREYERMVITRLDLMIDPMIKCR